MNIDNIVLEFIRNARQSVHADSLSESEEAKLKVLFVDCLSAVISRDNETQVPTLIICNTYNKYSTILPVRLERNKYKYYLLYDIHLNEINRLLNAIYYSDQDSEHDIWKLSYELFAEDSLLEENEALLSYYGLNKVALGPFEITQNDQIASDFILDIQERYVMGHELGHWIYRVSANIGTNSITNFDSSESSSVLLAEIKELLSELYATYEKNFQEQEYIELIREQKVLVLENDRILEECFADAIAYAMVFKFVQDKYPNDQSQLLLAGQALFLEMMSLQLLAMQHMTITEESFEASTSVRLGFFRNYTYLYFEEIKDQFEHLLNKTVIRYEKRITNPMLECFAELERRADNIYCALADADGLLDTNKILGLSNVLT